MPGCTILCLILILIVILYVSYHLYSTKEPLILCNLSNADVFVNTHHKQLFVGDFDTDKIGYIVTYHTQHPEKDMSKWKKKLHGRFVIVIDGEPNPLKDIEADAIITTKAKPNLPPNTPHVFLPYFVYSFKQVGVEPTILIKQQDEVVADKQKFCCFMYSNCQERYLGVIKRKQFYYKMCKRFPGRVDNLGRCYNKSYSKNGWWQNNIDIYNKYKFVISFENQPIDGYISEKLWVPMVNRSIPIYYGAPDIKKYFNTKSFINVNDFDNFDECMEYIDKVDKDENLYHRILQQPFYHNNLVDISMFSYHYGGEFYHNLKNILPTTISKYMRPCQFYVEDIHFVTYSDYKNKPPLFKKAQDTGFFKKLQFISGYTLPEPKLILECMEMVEDFDIIVLIHPTIIISPSSTNFFDAFYHLLLQDGKDMILFYDIQKVFQFKIIMLKKNKQTIAFVENWKSKYQETQDSSAFLLLWNEFLTTTKTNAIIHKSDNLLEKNPAFSFTEKI